MAGKLVQVATETVTSAVASVTLTGIDSDDVYMVAFNNLEVQTDARSVGFRVTTSGTADTSSNYDESYKALISNGTFGNGAFQNQNIFIYSLGDSLGTAGQEKANGIVYLYNFNNASEYSFASFETSQINSGATHRGNAGGGVHTVAQSCDGISIVEGSGGNILGGTFTLYRVV